MYHYITASVVEKGKASNWQVVNIRKQPFATIFQKYQNAIITLSDVRDFKQYYLDLYKLPLELRQTYMTLEEYITSVGILPNLLEKEIYSESEQYARFLFLNRYNFSTKPFNHKFHEKTELLPDQQTDLFVYRNDKKEIDYKHVIANSLVTVNGMCFQANSSDNGFFIYGAGKCAWSQNEARVGLIDFNRLGGLKTHSIDPRFIKGKSNGKLRDTFYLDTTFPLSGKTVFLVIGGILYTSVVKIVNEQRLKISLRNIRFDEHYHLIKERIDVSELPINKDVLFDDKFNIVDFYSDEYLRELLSLPESFLVVVNSPNLNIEYRTLKNLKLPGMYVSLNEEYPDKPVRMTDGLFAEYNVQSRIKFYVLSCNNYLKENKMDRTDVRQFSGIRRDQHIGRDRWRYADAREMIITK